MSQDGVAPCHVGWSLPVGSGVDGLLVHDSTIVTVSPEYLQAFDRHTGAQRWAAEMSDTEGSVRGAVVGNHLVLAPDWSEVQAFSLDNGAPVTPIDVQRDQLPQLTVQQLPDGYEFSGRVVTRAGRQVWRTHGRVTPAIGELGRLLVVNETMVGVTVVDLADGSIVLQPPLGTRNYPPSRVVVVDDCAYTMAATASSMHSGGPSSFSGSLPLRAAAPLRSVSGPWTYGPRRARRVQFEWPEPR